MAEAQFEMVRARGFQVLDADGRIRIALTAQGMPRLTMYDEAGHHRATLAVLTDGASGLTFFDENGRGRCEFRLWGDGESLLNLNDEADRPRLALRVGRDGSPGVEVFDGAGQSRGVLGSVSRELARASKIQRTEPSSLLLLDGEGKVLFKAP